MQGGNPHMIKACSRFATIMAVRAGEKCRAVSGGRGYVQLRSAVGRVFFVEDFLSRARTRATTCCNAKRSAQLVQRADAVPRGASDLLVSDCVADTDVHGVSGSSNMIIQF